MMKIGVLALQGAFIEHEQMLEKLGAQTFEIRNRKDLSRDLDGIILPGGESTVQGKLLRETDMFTPLQRLIESGLPVFGTCAGLLLLAKKIENDERVHLSEMDITAVRNAYGRQLGSFSAVGTFAETVNVPMIFIRAPYIRSVYGRAQALARVDNKIVAARQDNMLVTAFHPELSDDATVHSYFFKMIDSANGI